MSISFKGLYRFGEFELSATGRAFLRNGTAVSVSPKAFEVLAYLVLNPGRVVTKEELMQAVWPDSFVEESNLAQHISWLRKALGDKSSYIVTVPGRGYQFTANVQPESLPESLPKKQAGDILVQRVRERTHMVVEESSPAPLPAPATRVSGRVWRCALVTAGVLALAMAAGWKLLRRAAPPEFRKIVVADFINSTGDAAFDHTLRRALEIDLEQSPFLEVMSEGEAAGTLRLMGQKADVAMTAELAREVCVRSNRQVFLTGAIASLGNAYLMTLEAVDCNSGKYIVTAKEQVGSKEKVLGALDVVAEHVRTGLGESAKSVESFDVPILQATTSSLEALKAYSIAVDLAAQGKEAIDTQPFLQRAVDLDPKFAMAYGALATNYYNLNEYKLASEYLRKAFDLSDQVSEKEKLIIRAHYYAEGQKDLEQGIKTYQLWAATYPHDWAPWLNIANQLTQLGQYDPAIPPALRALEMAPKAGINYNVLARAYKHANRFADAKSVGVLAVQRGKDSSGLHATLFEIAFAEQDQNALAREIKWGGNNPDDWYFLDLKAAAAATAGKIRQAEDLFQRSYETAKRLNLPEAADDVLIDLAIVELQLGLPAASRATLRRIGKFDPDSSDLAVLQARLGDPSSAERFVADHGGETHNTLMNYVYVPLVRATLAVECRNPQNALAALEPATHYELADYTVPTLRGEAYLQAKRPEPAADEYKKILAHQGVDPISVLFPLAHVGLARAYALQNDKTGSRNEYEKFFAMWKDADADVPVLKQARAEYAHIQ